MLNRLAILFVRGYQFFVSPFLQPTCRYSPSCSHYAADVLQHHTFWNAIRLIIRRLGSCHPWGGYGYDPPPKPNKPAEKQN